MDNLWVFVDRLWKVAIGRWRVKIRMIYATLHAPTTTGFHANMQYILALDQGTSSSRAIVFDAQGTLIAQAQEALQTAYPADGWVEQDPEAIWDTVINTARRALAESAVDLADVIAVGITNQRETTVLWDRATGAAVAPAIVWQDRRTAETCERMQHDTLTLSDGSETLVKEHIAARTGLLIDPYFSSTKLAWLLHSNPGLAARAERGELCFGTVDSFLLWRLTGGQSHKTDASNASRTQLFDIHQQQWSEPLLQYFNIPSAILPEVGRQHRSFWCDAIRMVGR